jgi:hypothetical protein
MLFILVALLTRFEIFHLKKLVRYENSNYYHLQVITGIIQCTFVCATASQIKQFLM